MSRLAATDGGQPLCTSINQDPSRLGEPMSRTSALARAIDCRMERSALCEDITLVDARHDNAIRWRPGERLQHLFEQRCDELHAGNGPQEAVISEGKTYSFRDLDNRANQVARFLIEQGIKAGD